MFDKSINDVENIINALTEIINNFINEKNQKEVSQNN